MAILNQLLCSSPGRMACRFSRSRVLPLLAALVVAACVPKAVGQSPSREYQIKAVLLFNLTQFVEWPESAFPSSNAPLVIGILGDDPFGSVLDDAVRGEKINNHPIAVTRFRKVDEARNCQILFISQAEQKNFQKIITKLGNSPVLTVADVDGFIPRGGMIHFFKNPDDKIRLKINPDAVKASNLSISAKLLRVAEIARKEGK